MPPRNPDARDLSPAAWVERIEAASRSTRSWLDRSEAIRIQVLVAAGLWPEFPRPPVRAEVYGRRDHDGYSVEKVRIETWPGFWLAGNLYRPAGPAGWRPAVLSLHGHWPAGRFAENESTSLPGRAIGLARLGVVVLSTDMVGYGDTTQLPHDFQDVPWGVSLLGLQLWNNIRALDFLERLPGVDPARMGVTGASGGATQTFLLAATDARVACSIPVNMVTAGCQGGCQCENAPLLRLDLNNVEIAAAIAPRPLMLISCTGDWTAKTEQRDAPVVARTFAALGAADRFRAVTVNADHNFNRESRELAYGWIARWLLGAPTSDPVPEAAFAPANRKQLSVWDRSHPRPARLMGARGLAGHLRRDIAAQLRALFPRDRDSLSRFRATMLPAMRATLAARVPLPAELAVEVRRDGPAPVLSVVTEAEAGSFHGAGRVVILRPHVREAPVNSDADTETEEWIRWRESHPLTYYRTELARQVQDVLCAVAAFGGPEIRLEGKGDAGVPVLLARSLLNEDAIGLTVADLGGADAGSASFWTGERSLPGILRIGGLTTAAILAAPGPVELRGGAGLDTAAIHAAWAAARSSR